MWSFTASPFFLTICLNPTFTNVKTSLQETKHNGDDRQRKQPLKNVTIFHIIYELIIVSNFFFFILCFSTCHMRLLIIKVPEIIARISACIAVWYLHLFTAMADIFTLFGRWLGGFMSRERTKQKRKGWPVMVITLISSSATYSRYSFYTGYEMLEYKYRKML